VLSSYHNFCCGHVGSGVFLIKRHICTAREMPR
jgi:hypothetical protein